MTVFIAWVILAWATAVTLQPDAGPLGDVFAGPTPGEITARLAETDGDLDFPDPTRSGSRVFAPGALGRLTNTTCRADLIVVGVLESVRSYLTSDASTIYSEWRVRPTTALKDRRGAATEGEATVVFMRGGSMTIGGRTVTVANRRFATGLEPGAEFLIFATAISGRDALVATAGFRLAGDEVRRASARSIYPALEAMDRSELVATIGGVVDRTAHNPMCAGTR